MIKFAPYDEAILSRNSRRRKWKTSKFNKGDFREAIVTFFGALYVKNGETQRTL